MRAASRTRSRVSGEVEASGASLQRRMAEQRRCSLRRANARVKQEDRGRKEVGEHHHVDAKLLESSKAAGARRNGGAALDRAPTELLRRRRG